MTRGFLLYLTAYPLISRGKRKLPGFNLLQAAWLQLSTVTCKTERMNFPKHSGQECPDAINLPGKRRSGNYLVQTIHTFLFLFPKNSTKNIIMDFQTL